MLALARLQRFEEADERLARLAAVWRDDARYVVTSAYVGVQRGDLDRAEEWLRAPAGRLLDREASPLLRLLRSGAITLDLLESLKRELKDKFQERLEEILVAEQYFYVLLWQRRFDLARGYADRMVASLAERLRGEPAPAGLGPFQEDIVQAVLLQQAFFRKAVPLRASGRSMAEVYGIPEGRQASSRLVAAWGKMHARYPSWSTETSESIYHHLCALDLF